MNAKTTILTVFLTAYAGSVAAERLPPDAHYKAGMKAFADEDLGTAVEELAASLQAHPQAKTAIYLGTAYLKLGELGKARDAFAQAIDLDPKTARRDDIVKLIQQIEQRHVGTVQITSTPVGATVYLPGKASRTLGKTPVELALAPGLHRVVVEKEAYEPTTKEVMVTFGETVALDLALRTRGCDLSLASPTSGVRAVLDGEGIVVPTQLRVAPGNHRVTFFAKGYESQELDKHCESTVPGPSLLAEVKLARPKRYALGAAITFTSLAALAEAAALIQHAQSTGTSNAEIGLHVAAGGLAAGAVVGYVLDYVLPRRAYERLDRLPPRVVATPIQQGGAVQLSWRF